MYTIDITSRITITIIKLLCKTLTQNVLTGTIIGYTAVTTPDKALFTGNFGIHLIVRVIACSQILVVSIFGDFVWDTVVYTGCARFTVCTIGTFYLTINWRVVIKRQYKRSRPGAIIARGTLVDITYDNYPLAAQTIASLKIISLQPVAYSGINRI